MAKLLCSCLYLFDAIIELHVMNERCSMTFSIEVNMHFIRNKGIIDSWFIFCICTLFMIFSVTYYLELRNTITPCYRVQYLFSKGYIGCS